jgi:AraC-like DNA-binding protein
LQHRSLGWINGSAGIALGEHSPICLRTPGGNGLVAFYAPFKGHLRVNQNGQVLDTLKTPGEPGMVSEAATACGLTHFGRFSRDFKLRFGLLPSEVHSGRTHQGGESQFRAETQATAAAVQH